MAALTAGTRPVQTSRSSPGAELRHGVASRSRRRQVAAKGGGRSSQNGAMPSPPPPDDGLLWETSSIPEYMQQDGGEHEEMCESWEATLRGGAAAGRDAGSGGSAASALWQTIRREAQADAASEPLLSSFLYASILSHDSFERSLAFVLSNRLSDATFLSTELFEVFYSILRSKPDINQAALADIAAVRERDPACMSYSQALLHFKGFHAIQAHRIAHELWSRGRRVMAVALQSRMSEVFAVDIHPAARFGKGILLDHGTGVVIGETAELGDNVSILQNVTLGGTGKVHGDRHPKISDNVLIGASASILGNIRVGKGAQVAAGSLVLKPVPPRTLVAGSPAKEIGTIKGNPALKLEQWCIDTKEMLRAHLDDDPFATTPTTPAPGSSSTRGGSSKPAAPAASSGSGGSSGERGSSRDGGGGGGGGDGESSSGGASQPPREPAAPAAAASNGAAPAAAAAAGPQQNGSAPAAAAAAAAEQQPPQEQQQPQQQEEQRGEAGPPQRPRAPSASSKAAAQQAAAGAAGGGKGQRQRDADGVEAVTSDRAAQQKWPAKKSSPPEYFI